MNALADFPVTQHWPAEHPDRIQLYSMATPNGQKVGIALEEMGLAYEPHTVNILEGDQHTDAFKSLNPNSKIPAIVDPDGPGGKPIGLFESGAILHYLADKTGKLQPADAAGRLECMQWVFFQMGGVGPMFGQFGHFYKFARESCDHPYPVDRYTTETKRLLGVLEARLEGRDFLMGADYTIADVATVSWVRTLYGFYEAGEHLGVDDFSRTIAWADRCAERPATARGMAVCSIR
jgi:GST-like protein